jgi:SsrA-binding protein
VLKGTEVKAIREGTASLRESFVRFERGEAYLFNAHIGQYSHGGSASHDPLRSRKLLLHKHELDKLLGKTAEKGLTVVPLRMYFKKGRLKVVVALSRGKKMYDKRETIRRRETDRETRSAVKTRRV